MGKWYGRGGFGALVWEQTAYLAGLTSWPSGRPSLDWVTIGRTATIEADDVFPLLRGRDIRRFAATTPRGQCVIVPQRGMFCDESLPATRPLAFKFLSGFKDMLEQRSSYRRFQQGKPFWSVWPTGEYTFAPYKVVWE